MTYDQWKADEPDRGEHPGVTYDPVMDDVMCNYCGKPQLQDGPTCRFCRGREARNDNDAND